MHFLRKYYYKIIYRFSNTIRVNIARSLGVNFTEDKGEDECRILTDPLSLFGTEPYLIKVGKHVTFTYGVRLITHDGGVWCLRNYEGFENVDSFAPITIGDNCFFGNNVIVLPGVIIGNNCIVAAGSIVTKDIPDNCIVGGIPARKIKSLEDYKESKRKKMLNTKNLKNKERILRQAFSEWFDSLK